MLDVIAKLVWVALQSIFGCYLLIEGKTKHTENRKTRSMDGIEGILLRTFKEGGLSSFPE